jgi:hypothetical protein
LAQGVRLQGFRPTTHAMYLFEHIMSPLGGELNDNVIDISALHSSAYAHLTSVLSKHFGGLLLMMMMMLFCCG